LPVVTEFLSFRTNLLLTFILCDTKSGTFLRATDYSDLHSTFRQLVSPVECINTYNYIHNNNKYSRRTRYSNTKITLTQANWSQLRRSLKNSETPKSNLAVSCKNCSCVYVCVCVHIIVAYTLLYTIQSWK